MKNKVGIIRKILAAVIMLLVLVFFSACGLYYFERDGQPDAFSSIGDAMWYILLTLTTVGYGSVYPLTFGGKLITIFTAVIGSLIGVACFIGIVLGTLKLGTFLRKTQVRILNR
ncbi:MAG: potassium channel family protein [Candidatus Poribacteria bacterium]|nr:potassium channel family protein [Candidatus Poribacteria bacterium]